MNWKLVALLVAIFFLIFITVFPKALYSMGKEFIDKISFIKFTEEQKLLNQQQKVDILEIDCRTYLSGQEKKSSDIDSAYVVCYEFIAQSNNAVKNKEILERFLQLYDRENNLNIEKVIEIREKLLIIEDDDNLKEEITHVLLQLYFKNKDFVHAEEKANYLIENAKDSSIYLDAVYYMAKIQEEKK
ncbi:hypothetical protein HZA96_04105 [Candidatus Woesearchaeota archaeon]|nr:hypothetical protein [Candidatus Woesearchaeota archaeon]